MELTNRRILLEEEINAHIGEVWDAWSTADGCRTFFAPDCFIEFEIGGAYEMYFMPEGDTGFRGGEGCTILAIQHERMLSFTWNAPPSMPEIRAQFTHVTLYFEKLSESSTKLTLIHDGWGDGEKWDEAFYYFEKAWGDVVLPRLKERFANGPIAW